MKLEIQPALAGRVLKGYVALSAVVFVVTFLLALAFPNWASAETTNKPLSSGTIEIKARAEITDPDRLDTASIGLRRIDTGDLVFCVPAAPGALVVGESDSILNQGSEILLQAFSFSEIECGGLESNGSEDLYRVVFGAPGRPELIVD